MKARIASLPPRALFALVAAAVLVYAVAAWFLVVSPKRFEVSSLGAEVALAEIRLAEARAAANRPESAGVPVSDVFRLAKAMPRSDDQPGLVLELDRLARASGVTLGSITPQAPVLGAGGATMIPVAVTVGGTYFEISRFLTHTRGLVTVRRGKLRATGRLFTVQSVELVESAVGGFPLLDAAITLNAYVYDGPIVPLGALDAPAEELPTGGTSAAGGTP